jgi:hypothetical protein
VMVAKIGNWQDSRTLLENYAYPEDMEGFAEEVFGARSAQNRHRKPTKNLKIIRNHRDERNPVVPALGRGVPPMPSRLCLP